ncbi:hypothetical protein ACWC4J_42805, partial [Streptomyces sp. NPDC001356]
PEGRPAPGPWTELDADAARERNSAADGADGFTTHEFIDDGPHRVIAVVELDRIADSPRRTIAVTR